MNVFELSAMLTLNSSDYEKGLDRAKGTAKVFGDGFKKVGKAMAVGIAAGAGAIAALSKKSVDAYANYEQLAGGVKKLYQSAAGDLMKYANEAYKTSGMSANQYMETATSFSAALVNSLGGNYKKAAAQTDVAMRAISDNFNTFGGDIGMIQNAFQGFAKGQFMMLDNLKLGYGGTKTEMERLIKDAEEYAKANGKAADLSVDSFADIVTAIQLIQEKQHIAGTTANEAATTIEGSTMAAKAAWENLLTGFADSEQDIGKLASIFVEQLTTAANNIVPRFVQAFRGMAGFVPDILNSMGAQVVRWVNDLPGLLKTLAVKSSDLVDFSFEDLGGGLLESLAQAIETVLPAIETYGGIIAENLGSAIISALSSLGSLAEKFAPVALGIMESIGNGLVTGIPALASKVLPIITEMSGALRKNIKMIVEAGASLVLALAQGIANSLPTLIEYIPTIVTNIAGIINDNMPVILETGVKIIVILAKGIVSAMPTIVANIPKILKAVASAFLAFSWGGIGKGIAKGLGSGIKAAGGAVKAAVKRMASGGIKQAVHTFASARSAGANMVKAIGKAISAGAGAVKTAAVRMARGAIEAAKSAFGHVADIGMALVRGIWAGISSGAGWIKGMIRGWVGNVKSFLKSLFGIHSPSAWARDEIGANLVKGMALGIDANSDLVDDAMAELMPEPEMEFSTVGANEELFGMMKQVSMVNNITVDGAENPEEFASRFVRQLRMDMRTA